MVKEHELADYEQVLAKLGVPKAPATFAEVEHADKASMVEAVTERQEAWGDAWTKVMRTLDVGPDEVEQLRAKARQMSDDADCPPGPTNEREVATMSTNTDVDHADGVTWFDAPMPPRSHECQAQSTYRRRRYSEGLLVIEQIDRCACGGLRYDGFGPWICQYEGVAEDRIPAHQRTDKA